MHQAITVSLLTLAAGAAMPLGASIACWERIRPHWLELEFRHSVIAFGGGALLAAVALVLVPEGCRGLPIWAVAVCFSLGGISFMLLDRVLAASRNSGSQLIAMLSDFIPESLALGAAFSTGGNAGPLLALLIGIQNLPEGFNAYRELKSSSNLSAGGILRAFLLMSLLGPVAGLTGLYLLAGMPEAVSGIMLFAAGGILYLTFQDIAPQAQLERHWAPPLGAIAGFLLGLIGQLLIHPNM